MATDHVMFDDFVKILNSTIEYTTRAYDYVPGSAIVWRYIQNSYQNDPFRVGLELLLLVFAFQYLMHKKKRPRDDKMVKLTEKEIEELVDEWQPEPLTPSLTDAERLELEKVPIIVGPQGAQPIIKDAKALINLASYNFLGVASSENVKTKAIAALRKYGVGSCGPPGFYGTIDVHMDLEKQIADFLGTEEAIIYSQGFSTISSVIPAFAKRGDIIVCDEGVSFAIQKGVQISRSVVRRFKHNDMEDLERVLEEIESEALKKKSQITRRFIVVEGLYLNYGDIAPLPRIVELKKKYKYRLILDETVSFGTLGSRGAGLTDYYSVPIADVEFIVGSLCHSLCSSGGFCAGSHIVCDHQRLAGLSYCYSASIPALLAVAATEAIHQLQLPATGKSGATSGLKQLKDNTTAIRNILANAEGIVVGGSPDSPVIHLRLQKDSTFGKDAMTLDVPPSSAAAEKATASSFKRQEEERLLQDIVDEAANDGVLLTRAKYLWDQEVNAPAPSIRICASAALTKRESEKAATIVKTVCARVLARKR